MNQRERCSPLVLDSEEPWSTMFKAKLLPCLDPGILCNLVK